MLVLLPIFLFILLFAPYLFIIPGGDGNTEYKFALSLADGSALSAWLPYHPPFKLLLFAAFFHTFGYWSIGFIGLILGSIGIFALYTIANELFDKKVALLSSFLLGTSGLYLSVGLLSLNDFVMTVLILVALAWYVRSEYVLYSVFACLAVMTKETAIFFVLSVFFVQLLQKKKHIILFIVPIVFLVSWFVLINLLGFKPWNFYNFSPTADKGSTYTIMHNIFSLQIFNRYAYENWLHLFVFNFNWVYTLLACIGLMYLKKVKKRKELLVIGIFFLTFTTLILSFQTWTINRYTLPMLPILYLFASFGISKLHYQKILIGLVMVIAIISLSHSRDPISNRIWPKINLAGEPIYLNELINGGDGITYNAQYLNLMGKRTEIILHGNCVVPKLLVYDPNTLLKLGITRCP
jgi:uncharacterized membrane protein